MSQNVYDDPRFFEEYRRMREPPATINDLVEGPALKSCLPPLEGLEVLELGCGMGQLSLYLAGNGAARVLATDVSARMLEVAKSGRPHERIEYRLRAMQNLEPPASFDLVVGSLSVHYVEDHLALARRVEGWLRPGGTFVYSVEHPMKTAPRDPDKDRVRDAEGNELHWPVSGYGEEGPREQNWLAGNVVKYHRKLSTMLNDLTSAGMTVERVEEPEEVLAPGRTNPVFPRNAQRPSVLIVTAVLVSVARDRVSGACCGRDARGPGRALVRLNPCEHRYEGRERRPIARVRPLRTPGRRGGSRTAHAPDARPKRRDRNTPPAPLDPFERPVRL